MVAAAAALSRCAAALGDHTTTGRLQKLNGDESTAESMRNVRGADCERRCLEFNGVAATTTRVRLSARATARFGTIRNHTRAPARPSAAHARTHARTQTGSPRTR
ncbi:unnamed protein product [Anisakis simplex]|uniref:Secreted protein n=1 Tax=Anisakis simplex TaxID=6269 RepID=A0A0M3JFM2_ANISI|nr:unnamed protein product [Anisakis simplex]